MKKFSKINEDDQWASSNRIANDPLFQEVEVYIFISGDYCAFHEMNFGVAYDVTNNKSLGYNDMTLIDLQNFRRSGDDYSDYKLTKALKIGDKYYVDFDSI